MICQYSQKNMFSLPQSSQSLSSPTGVILLRALAFLICAFLVATSVCELLDQNVSPSNSQTLSGGVVPPKPEPHNESTSNNGSSGATLVWQGLLELLPDSANENAKLVLQHGRDNQLAIVCVGLLTCLTAIFLAGPTR